EIIFHFLTGKRPSAPISTQVNEFKRLSHLHLPPFSPSKHIETDRTRKEVEKQSPKELSQLRDNSPSEGTDKDLRAEIFIAGREKTTPTQPYVRGKGKLISNYLLTKKHKKLKVYCGAFL